MALMQQVAVLGATGSIGTSALDVISRHPGRMRASVLSAGSQVDALLALCRTHRPDHAVIAEVSGSGISCSHGRCARDPSRNVDEAYGRK